MAICSATVALALGLGINRANRGINRMDFANRGSMSPSPPPSGMGLTKIGTPSFTVSTCPCFIASNRAASYFLPMLKPPKSNFIIIRISQQIDKVL